MNKEEKKAIIKKYQKNKKDTGSAEVQVAILTTKINKLQDHFKVHKKDKHSRKGLLAMIGKRQKFLRYLRLHEKDRYTEILKNLKLRK